MRNTLPVSVRKEIDRAMKPAIGDFKKAVSQMREAGATDDEVEQVIEAAIATFSSGPLEPNATAYALEKFRQAVGLASVPASRKPSSDDS